MRGAPSERRAGTDVERECAPTRSRTPAGPRCDGGRHMVGFVAGRKVRLGVRRWLALAALWSVGVVVSAQGPAPAASMAPAAPDELRNWFDDPFFAISSAIADCPVPAGPFVTEA